jgi:long-chain acyl-CoA synthetase
VIVPASGKNIYPVELEAHYKQSSIIKDISIFGLPENGRKSETVHAAVIVSDQLISYGEEVAYEWLAAEIDKLSLELPSYKRVKSFNIWRGDFPRVSTGKVQKFEVRKQVIESREGNGEKPVVSVSDELLMTHEEAHYLCEQLLELAPRKVPLFPNTLLSVDLGLDSLRLTELLLRMEKKYSCKFPVEQMATVRTVKDAISFVERCMHS